jgi:hypothetical protein
MRAFAIVVLLCGCSEDEANAGGTDTDTGTDPTMTAGSASNASAVSGSSGDEPDTSTTTPDTTGDPTIDDPTSTTGSTTDEPVTTSGMIDPATVLVTIDNAASPPALVVIDPSDASTTETCALGPSADYDAIVFTRDGDFLAHNLTGDRIELVDPCDCGFVVLGTTDVGSLEMTVDAQDGLIGITLDLDAYISVDPATGLANLLGPLGVDLDAGAIAWSDATAQAHVLDATADQLYVLDTRTGALTNAVPVLTDLVLPAMDALGPADAEILYVCDGTTLYTIDPVTAALTTVGSLALTGACTTLGAPREAIACLEP